MTLVELRAIWCFLSFRWQMEDLAYTGRIEQGIAV